MFLLGHWKNYDELEEQLSLDELMKTLEAFKDKEYRDRKFMAALKGIDLDANSKSDKTITERSAADNEPGGLGIDQGIGYNLVME